ncbi:MAG: CHAT domain-containing protein, partial [Myxococcales bacterium]|nr:CHAT domain-containing protein [Myxococcales bacterium]
PLGASDLRAVGEHVWTGLVGQDGLADFLWRLEQETGESGRQMRLVLEADEADDPALALLPFELAYSNRAALGGRYEWKRADPRLVRVLVEGEAPPVRFEVGARLLIVTAADPARPAPTVAELKAHAAQVAAAARKLGWTVDCLEEATPAALEARLREPADLLYVVAHGRADSEHFGRLALAGGELLGGDLKMWLDELKPPCRAVILCACSSAETQPTSNAETTGMAQELSRRATHAAIGFRAPVVVSFALQFMERLFTELAHSTCLETAFAQARARLSERDPQWVLPVYYGRRLAPERAAPVAQSTRAAECAVHSLLPQPPRRYFTAREAELERLRHLTRTPGTAVVQALEGEGGVGKSELARKVAFEVSAERPVLWLDRPDRDPKLALGQLVRAVPALDAEALADLDDHALAALVREQHAGHGGLLVLDDVSDGSVVELLAPAPDWNTLVTTRVDHLVPGAQRVELGHLNAAEALLLFCRIAYGTDAPPRADAHAATRLVGLLEGLPLAVELAAESVSKGGTAASYLDDMARTYGAAWADGVRLAQVLSRNLSDQGEDERAVFEALGVLP